MDDRQRIVDPLRDITNHDPVQAVVVETIDLTVEEVEEEEAAHAAGTTIEELVFC